MRRFLALFAFLGLSVSLFSQPCTGVGGAQSGPTIVFGDPGNLSTTIPGMIAGDYALLYVCAGNTYTLTTCGTLAGDSEISVLDDTGMIITGIATDFADANTCGNHETLVWTAPAAYASGGYVQVVVSQNTGVISGPCQGGIALPMADLMITASAACSPVGADCLNPYTAAFPVSESGLTTCGFGNSYSTSSCGDDNYLGGEDFVISFTVPGGSGGCYTIDVTNSSTYTGIQILDGCPDAGGSCIGFAGSAAADPSLQVNLADGGSYFMIISTFPLPDCTGFDIDMTPCPDGTNCESPFVIPGLPFSQGGFTTQGFTNDYSTSSCGDDNYLGGEDFVFSLSVPPGSGGCYDIELTGTDNFAGIQVLDGCPDAGGSCVGFAGSSGTNPSIRANLIDGTDYVIIVSTFPAPDFTPFDIAINACPPGSDCSDPFVIASVPFSQSNTTEGFGNDYTMAPGCDTDDDYISGEDYVMEFTPSNSGCYDLSLSNGDSYLGLFVSTTCPPSNCDAYAESGTGNSLQTNVYLDAGTTYYITVSTWDAPAFSPFDFDIAECAADGEDCNAPTTITVGTTSSLTTCAMGDNYDDNDACGSLFMNGDDVIMEFTVSSDGCYDVAVSNASNAAANFGAFILDGCPDAGATCIARGEEVGGTPTFTANLTAGTYTLVVATDDCSDFDVLVSAVACPAGANCANPLVINQGANGPIDMAGSGDDYEDTDACGGDYLGGNDFVMTFVPGSTDCYSFTTSSAAGSNAAADLGLFILDDCPDAIGANCLAFDEVDNGFPMADAYLQSGQTYYIVVGAIEDQILGPVPSTTVFNLDVSTGGTNCPPGANCGNPAIVNTGFNGPYDICGAGNDYDDTDGCMSIYMNGEDFVMEFTPSSDDCYDFILNGTGNSNPAADVGLFVLEDCPTAFGVNCLINETQNNGFPMGTAPLMGGQTYYIVVSAIETPLNTASCTEFELTINSGSSGCPMGETCSNALDLPSLGNYSGLTSCGAGNDYDQSMATNCSAAGDVYLDGEDFVMTFTPSSSGCHNFQFSNPTDPDADSGVFIYDGCPDSNPGCVGFATSENGVPDNVITDLVAGQTYYIVFSAIDFVNAGGTGIYSASCNGFDLDIVACDPPQPVQDCIGAIPVCDGTYFYDDGFLGDGNVNNESPVGNCLSDNELNSVWFVITIDQDGDFNFLITPENALDDYDFAVFDITSGGCSGISSGASPELSCNYALSPGATGAGPGPGLNSQGADGILLNGAIPVTAGQTLVLLVSNFSSSNDGFTLDIGSSPDVTAPTFTSVTDPVACGASTFTVEFSEPVDCSTFAPCDFTVVFPDNTTHALTDVTSGSGCGTGEPFEQNFTFTVADALLQDGTYTLQLGSACGGVEDNCGNVQDNTSITFDVMGITCMVVNQMDEVCGNAMGSLEVAASGGTSYTYTLNGGASQASGVFNGLSAGTYTIVATDISGCTCQSMVTIMDAGTPPTIDNVTVIDATCGGSNGSATVTISSGTAPYDVEINGITVSGNSPVTVTGLAAGTYPVNVTDANNCTVAGSVTINDAAAPTIDNVTATDATCGAADGSATVTISSGTAPYDVEINGITVSGNSPVTVTGLAAGTYPVNVTDANNCTVAGSVTINDAAAPTIDNVTATDATCSAADGSATITISGGTAPYDVEINGITVNGNSPVTVTGLAAGTYPVNVTDANNCTVAGSVTINDAAAPTIDNVTATDATCGAADGTATITISGGTAPYDVEINGITVNGNSPVTVTGLAAGTYPVNVTDANNCTVAGSVTINDAAAPTIDNVTATDATCGDADGTATVTISGGTAPYDVEINGITVNSNSPVTVTGLAAGTYPVNVTDANNCTVAGSVTINDAAAPTIDNVTATDATCGAADGSATVTISSGTAPYDVEINGITVSGNSPVTVTGLAAGTYPVNVTDANNCTVAGSVTINDAAAPTIDNVTATDATCGAADGSATVTISSGTAPYDVEINGITVSGNSPVTVTGLAAGIYPVNVTDANNCTVAGSVTINDAAAPTIDNIIATDATCGAADGSATITISGGTAPYDVEINGITVNGNSPVTVTGLVAGTYPVNVTDANNCTVAGSVTINDAAAPTIDNVIATDATCGAADGTATVTISGGTAPYDVEINGITVNGNSPVTVTGLAAGTYPVNVTDANNCTVAGSVTINDAAAPTIDNITATDATCGAADGTATITISGGTAPYDVEINGITVSGNSPVTVTGLAAGTYPVNVTDANNCTVAGSVTINDAAAPTIDNITATDATCGAADGTATVMISGGTAPYDVEINGITVNGNSPVTVTGLAAGTYPVNVTDANNCTVASSVTINDVAAPTIDNVTATDATCGAADGTATVMISGGTAPYDVEINGITVNGNSPVTVTGLAAGTYPVNVTDANNCTVASSVTINDAAAPTIDNVTATDATCGQNNGAVEVAFSGGSAPYTLTVNGVTVTGNSPLIITGLPMGNYTVDLEDANLCSASDNVTIDDNGAPTIDNVTPTDATCGAADGTATVTISGGTASYTVEINGITVSGNSPVIVTGLAAGTYPVNVTDANNCTTTGTVTISDAGGPAINNITAMESTCGDANGQATVAISGGTAPYDVEINGITVNGNSPVTVTGLAAGIHIVNITDAIGCSTSGTVTIDDVAGPTISNVVTGDTDCGMTNGSLTINVSDGTAPITYDLNNGAFTQTDNNVFSNLDDGTYIIMVTDANGCMATSTATIVDIPGVVIDNVDVTAANCGQLNGAVTITVTDGPAPITYDLNGVVQVDNGTFNGLAGGTYPLTVTDANNCTATQNVTIDDLAGVSLDGITIIDATCGDTNGAATINITGGTAPITYTLDGVNQIDNNVYTGLAEGSYTVLITDDNDCTATGTAIVGGSEAPVIDNITTVDASCGQMDGSATINVSGGTPPYAYNLAGAIQNDPNNTFMMLASGNYALTITDANNCMVVGTVNITDADGPMIDNVATMNATCGMATGELTVTISGGQPPYDLLVNGVTQTSPNNTFTGLLPGNYPIQVTDANGCVSTTTATIEDTQGVMITDIMTVDATCGQANGSKTVTVSGGNAPYTFECNGMQQIDDGFFGNLSAGTYTVVVTDADGCTATQDVTINDTDGPMIDNVAVGDADCDMANGSLTINASEGLPPYNYTVDGNTQTGNVFTGLLPGVYDPIIVEDANGCTVMTTATIGNTPGVMITDVTTTDATCGQADGAKTITVAGGTAPYTFECNGVQQVDNGTFTGLPSGSYPILVTDANGCTATGTGNISDADGPNIDNAVATDATCGMNNGTITITASAGTAPYNVTVNGVTLQTSATIVFDNLTAGIYGIEVEDSNGCVASGSVEVIGIPGVVLEDVIVVDATCGQADGAKEIMISGGTAPYTFECNGVQQVDNGLFENLAAGTYPFTVTDANGCTVDGSATINDLNGPTIDNITVVDATNGNADGSITVTASGGTAPYTFTVNGTDITDPAMASFMGLAAGTYPILVTDANGCTVTDEAVINEGACPTITDITATNSVCGGTTGTITVTATGGEAPLMYVLDGNAPQASNEFMNVMAGVYTITVTDNAGCAVSEMITVEEDGAPTIMNIVTTAATCDENNGTAVITAAGGTPPYTYDITGIPQDEDTFTGLQPGIYTVTVADVNGCSAAQMFTIDDLAAPMVDDVLVANATCGAADGMVTIQASGGNGTLLYSFDGSAFTTNNAFTNVTAGGYDYAVMDDNCTITGVVAVSNDGAPTIASIEVTDASCGTADGALVINVMGGTPPLTYAVNSMTQIDNGTFNNLPAGDYTVVVTDANDCVAADVATINEVGTLTIAILGETTICAGDFTTLTADPLDQGYSFQWSTGATTDQIVVPSTTTSVGLTATLGGCTGTANVDITSVPLPIADAGTDVNMGCDFPSVTLDGSNSTGSNLQYNWTTPDGNIVGANNTAMIEVDAGGMYILEVMESLASCVGLDTVLVEQGIVPLANAGPDMELTCLVQAVTLDGSASEQGTDFQYTWTGPGITVSNMNQNSPQVTEAGEYIIEVLNILDNCSATDTVQVTENQTFPLAEIELVIPIDCNNQTIDIDGSNSSSGPNIIYQWLDESMNPIPGATSNMLTVATEGTYFLQVTDTENGCVSTASQEVNDITAYPLPSPSVSGVLTCIDLEVDLDGTGSSTGPDIVYEWFFNGNSIGTDLIIPTDTPGNYTLVVTDTNNNCTNEATVTVMQDILPPVADAGNDTELDCLDSTIFLNGNGSAQGANISYLWSGDNGQFISNATTLAPEISEVGVYTILVTNAENGCTATDEVVVSENTETAEGVELTFATPTCQGDTNGSVIVSNVIGGQGPFLYSLDGETFGSSSIFSNLTAGSYELSIQSANGCIYSEDFVLEDGNDLSVSLGEDIFINIGETATFTADFTIALTEVDTFVWTTLDTLCYTCLDQVVTPMSTTSYSIDVIDENGCTATDDLTIIVNEQLDVYVPNVFSPNGDGLNDMFFIQAQEGVVVEIKTFKIFNRWGAQVFENNEFMPNIPEEGWNGVFKGNLMNPQVFVYMIEVEFINGNVEMVSGDVTLMR